MSWKQLLSLFWEGEQFIDTLDSFFEHWKTAQPGFMTLASKPHYLVNLFDLSTRMDNAEMFRYLFAEVEGEGVEGRLLLRALAMLGNNPMLGAGMMGGGGGGGDDDDDVHNDVANEGGIEFEFEDNMDEEGEGLSDEEDIQEELDNLLSEMDERMQHRDVFSEDEEEEEEGEDQFYDPKEPSDG